METNDSSSPLPFGTRVEIGGRTMLRPGFSLVGLTGMVYLLSPGAPAGCSTVVVDWNAHGYTPDKGYPAGSLPPLVNVPTLHLTILDEEAQPVEPEKPKAAPKTKEPPLLPLRKVTEPPVSPEDEPTRPEEKKPSPDDETGGGRPKLRLV